MTREAKKILLVNVAYDTVYENVAVKEGVPYSPVLSLATIAGPVLKAGHRVKVVDLNLAQRPLKESFLAELKSFAPQYVGITFTTPLYQEMARVAGWVKEFDRAIPVIGGGAHISAFPRETLAASPLDIAVVGEGDRTLLEIIDSADLSSIPGVFYKDIDGSVKANQQREHIKDLDSLPYPAWGLFDLARYHTTDLLARKSPAGWLETSRGCVHGCVYCTKFVHGYAFRAKSVDRVLGEIEYMLESGFREIHIADDCFNYDMERAKQICRRIIDKKLRFPWATVTGIRVDRVDAELLTLMRQAGCYRVYYGIESGDPGVLKEVNKGTTVEQIRHAVKAAKDAKLEVFGFFMIGLPGETIGTMEKTVRLACELDLDMVKMSVTIPLPATRLYQDWLQKGLIKKKDWSKFNLYTFPEEVFDHPNLSWDQIHRYYKKFYRDFYWRPSFVAKRLSYGLRRGTLVSDMRHFLKTKWQ